MALDPIQLIQGGGVLAFAALVIVLLRDHQKRAEKVLERQADGVIEQAKAMTAFAGAMASMATELRAIRADIIPIQRFRGDSK